MSSRSLLLRGGSEFLMMAVAKAVALTKLSMTIYTPSCAASVDSSPQTYSIWKDAMAIKYLRSSS
jgi:hypothetical protein